MEPSWEFQAPQFVDFTNLEKEVEEDRRADQFFDVDMESGELWTTAHEETHEVGTSGDQSNGTLTVSSSRKSMLKIKVNKPSNLVTSWSDRGRTLQASSRTKPQLQQPAKKMRRLSNAIINTVLASSGNNNQHQQRLGSRRKVLSSIVGYKTGGTPKRLKTNVTGPRLSTNLGKSKGPESLKIQPTKGSATVTIPKPFKLSTEVRAEERKVLEEKKKKENKFVEEMKQKERERKEKEREAQISNYRKTLGHKAQPIKSFKSLEIKRSDKQLTFPESPKFAPKKVRCRMSSK